MNESIEKNEGIAKQYNGKSRSRRRTSTGSLGIPGLKLPRGVPTLVRGVGRLFKGSKKSSGASAAQPGSAWIWVLLGLALATWIGWGFLSSTRTPPADLQARPDSAAASGQSHGEPNLDPVNPEPANRKPSNASKPPAWKDGDWVRGEGIVTKVLPDDLEPPRHQRFIVKDAWDRTFLFAHNIDVARRVEGLAVGDEIRFRGEYKLNAQGGVIHWTHAPASGRGPGGWIERAGVTYR